MFDPNNLSQRRYARTAFALLLVSSFVSSGSEYHPLAAAEPATPAKAKPVPAYITVQHAQPKIRSVHTNKGLVRSGPADRYYVTQTLRRGSQVEVYMETSDGWSAIRPPSGSHNWIPSHVAYLLPGGKTAEIIEQDSPAWIGSESPDQSDFMWQIALAKTQQVSVLGEETQVNDDGKKQLWYRIAPPQGEFRWMRTAQLSDAQIAADREPRESPVQSASYQEPITESGKIVWSNEEEVLANVDAEIQREQASVQSQLAKDGIPVSSEDVGLPKNPSSGTKIRPIAANAKVSKAKGAEHQIDSFKQWDAMQSSGKGAKMRVGPVNSLLGLVGISVVEAERAPVNAQITRDYHASQGQNHLGQVGQVGSNRLDRLPRPGMRGSSSHSTMGSGVPNTTWPRQDYGSSVGQYGMAPQQHSDGTFARWLNSQEPLFQRGASTDRTPLPMDNSAWHGIAATDRSMIGNRPSSDFNQASMIPPTSSVSEFETPEIQSALVQLTQEISRPTEQWNLTALRGQASQWIENGATAMVRGEARLLMERIDRFESLRQRTLGFVNDTSMIAQQMARESANSYLATTNAMSIPSSVSGGAVVQASSQVPPIDRNGNSGGMQEGDASGWLVQVHTTNPGQPEFALTDDAGKVIAYVQSTAGLNLRRYLQQPVTIYGLRGYLPSLAAKQILAERVVRIR
jgi:SH3-like domain-containing protein